MKTELNPNARKWVDALRSGEYQQGRAYLVRMSPEGWQHCCLGVACELAAESGAPVRREEYPDVVRFNNEGSALPDSVAKWLGLRSRCGHFENDAKALYLENDNGKTFAEIADIIESQPQGLFA